MKNLILILGVLALIFGSLAIGYCDEIPYSDSPASKLERGVINMTTFWMELPAGVAKVSNEQNLAAGVTVGVVEGVVSSAIRGVSAIYDTVTFYIPSYTKPIMKPEYAWKAADNQIRALLW